MAKSKKVNAAEKAEVRQVVLKDSGFHGELGEEKPHYYVRRNGHIEACKKVGADTTIEIWLEAYGPLSDLPAGEEEGRTVWYEYCPSCKYRGEQWWEMYTDKQIAAVEKLAGEKVKEYGIRFWMDPYMGGRYVSEGAIGGMPGVYLGGCMRPGRVGCHPQIELMQALKRVATLSME